MLSRCLFLLQNRFRPSYYQISTDLGKILHTPIVVRNTLVGRLRRWPARGRLRAKPERLCFVILVTRNKSYIDTTNRRDFGGKPSGWRWGQVLLWKKNWNFVAWAEPDPKNSIFRVLRVSYDCPAHSLKQHYPKPMVTMVDTLKVCLLLVWRVCDQAFGRYRPLNGAERWSRDHHKKIEN